MGISKPTPAQVKEMREKAGLLQREAAEIFGYTVSAWQAKETTGKTSRGVAVGEWLYLLLLADEHPEYQLIKRGKILTGKE